MKGIVKKQEGITHKKQLFICEQLAQLKSSTEIMELWTQENPNDEKITYKMVNYYKIKYTPQIQDKRDKIMEQSLEIPIANEKIRLQRTETLYQAATSILNKKDMVNTSLNCLKEAREETKGETGSTQAYLQFNQFNELSDADLLAKKKELEEKVLELSKKGETFVRTDETKN